MTSGPTANVTSTLATVVSVIATMKAVNITAQHSPEAHTGQRARRSSLHHCAPRIGDRPIDSAPIVNALRQNVTSKLSAPCRWRVTTPAMLHISVTRTIRRTALE